MTDNFELIKPLLTFPSDDIYYHLQILRRGKDHPELPAANKMIKAYFICSLEGLDAVEEEVKKLTEFFEARAYINLTPKSLYKTALLNMKYLTQRIYEGDVKKIWKAWNTCAGEIKGMESRFVVDVDDCSSEDDLDEIEDFIDTLGPRITINGEKDITPSHIIAEIPTVSGFHIITRPFDVQAFRNRYKDIDIHKNNPTLLYKP